MKIRCPSLDAVFLMPRIEMKYLCRAKKTDLKVLYAVFASGKDHICTASLAEALGETEASVSEALAFWRGAGVLLDADDDEGDAVLSEAAPSGQEEPTVTVSGAKNDITGGAPQTPSYTLTELTAARARNTEFASLLSYIEKLIGKTLSAPEQGICLSLYDTVGMPYDLIMGVAQYCVSKGKNSVRYMEKTALALYEEGIHTYAELETHILEEQTRQTYETMVKRVIGAEARAFDPVERKYLILWESTYHASEALVTLAYTRTIDRIGKPKIAYMDKILRDWYENNLDTPEKIDAFYKQRQTQTGGNDTGAYTFDLDDIYEKPDTEQSESTHKTE